MTAAAEGVGQLASLFVRKLSGGSPFSAQSIREYASGRSEDSASAEIQKGLSRRLSDDTLKMVTAPVGARYSTRTATVIALNMVLGTGPLMLPYAFAQSGLILGAAFLAFCGVIAFITATYVIETLMLENADLFEHTESNLLRFLVVDVDEEETIAESLRRNRPEKVFKIRERIEMGEMGSRVFPGWLHKTLYLCIFLHTFGCLCVYAVALTASVQSLLPDGEAHHGAIVSGLACVVYPLCFMDVQKLRKIQFVVMGFRAAAILAMIGGACYLTWAASEGEEVPLIEESYSRSGEGGGDGAWMWGHIPLADPSGLPSLAANAVLAFMMHHSIPGFLAPLEDQVSAPRAVASAYTISYLVYIVLGFTALLAFGRSVPQLYNLAFGGLPKILRVYLFAYPLMLLAVYPIVGISLRNNLMNLLRLPPPTGPPALKDFASSAIAALPPMIVAYFTSNVQGIVKIFAGYFGLSLMLLMPCLMLRRARRKIHAAGAGDDFPLRSHWGSPLVMAIVVSSWAAAIVFNTYRFFFE